MSCSDKKIIEGKEGMVELRPTVNIFLGFLSSACIRSATLVHYYLASFLMYESPLGFQAPKLLWSWVLIIKYAFEEIADVLGKKK